MKDAKIVICTEEPDYSKIPVSKYDWSCSVYGDVKELTPRDAPKPLGKFVTLSHYVDANLFHDMVITGHSVTSILHFLNKMPINWYAKEQVTVETTTYGSKYVAVHTWVNQVVDLRLTLLYLGIPICEKSYMFGDNTTVINSLSKPHSKLHKCHNPLSFHHAHEAITSKYVSFTFLGKYNPADILSKHWGYQQVWTMLKPILFFHGDTAQVYEDD